jgi:release factor glutamine methyltransferase
VSHPLTTSSLLASAAGTLSSRGIEPATARREAEWILMHVLGCGRAELIARPETPVSAEAKARFQSLLERRMRREPLQYVLGETEFYGIRIQVTPDVLIPRPETEELVGEVLRAAGESEPLRVLDIGVGSGCIALALKWHRPGWKVVGCDLSEAALRVAGLNAERLGLDLDLRRVDLFDPAFLSHVDAPFDIVVSNPPYVPDEEAAELQPEVIEFEPHTALFSGGDPLRYYRRIAALAPRLLGPGGLLALECHFHHAGAVAETIRAALPGQVGILNDMAGLPRIVTLRR